MGDEYRRFRIASSSEELLERVLADAFEAGAEGVEDQSLPVGDDDARPHRACVYARAERIEAIQALLRGEYAGESVGRVVFEASEPLPAVDWSEEWKRGLGPIVISPRLVVRPPFAVHALLPGQREIVIDPGQAFGTGTHASTGLCLAWIDRLVAEPGGAARFDRMLDVGTGSGILAFAAVVLGAQSALGFDLDPVAIEAARASALANGLAERVELRCDPIEAIAASPPYPLVVANLLKRELLPIAGEIAARLSPQGRLILAGLLEEDAGEVAARFAAFGLIETERLERDDAVGRWIAPCYGFSAASRSSQSS